MSGGEAAALGLPFAAPAPIAPARMGPWRSAPHWPSFRATAARVRSLPALDDRSLLPAIEPERRIDDWGRSERIEGAFDRTVVEFFYRYWFRVEVEGIENVPAEGGALLVSNHSGALPPDAAMIGRAIREEHPVAAAAQHHRRALLQGLSRSSRCWRRRSAASPPTPPTSTACSTTSEGLVLVFPEGRKGTEKVYSERYRLRRFGRGGFVAAAMRARAKLVPVCVVGAEEAAPIFAQVGLMKKLTGLLYFPLTPTFPWLGPLGMLGYLPAKFRIRFLEPIDTAELGGDPDCRPGAGADGRPGGAGADPGEPARDARRAEVGLARMTVHTAPARRVLITGLATYWGGRLAAGARVLPRGRGDHRRRLPASRPASCTGPSTSRSAPSTR